MAAVASVAAGSAGMYEVGVGGRRPEPLMEHFPKRFPVISGLRTVPNLHGESGESGEQRGGGQARRRCAGHR